MSLTLHYDCLNNDIIRGPTPTITRAGSRWRFNSSGLLEAVSANTIAYDHDVNGNPLGWQIEETRENIALHNRDATDAVWSGGANMAVAKDATGMDGVSNSATTLTASAANARHSQPITIVSAERTFSIWLRRKTGSGTILVTDDAFVGTVDVTSGINSSTYTKVGDITTTQANPDIGVEIVTSGDEVEMDIGQIELGAFSTSPIITAAASVTRNLDNIGTADVTWLDAALTLVGSFYVKATTDGGPTTGAFLSVNDGGTTDENRLYYQNDDTRALFTTSGGQNGLILGSDNFWATGATGQLAYGYALDDMIVYQEGISIGTELDVAVGSGDPLTELQIGGIGTAVILNGHIAEIRYYNTRLTNQQLEDMSNGIFPSELGFVRDLARPLARDLARDLAG